MILYSLPSRTSFLDLLVRKAVLHSVANGIPYSTPSKKAAVASFPANAKKKSGPHKTSTALSTTVSFVTGMPPNSHLFELLVEFSLNAELDRFENIVHRHLGLVRWLGTLLEDADATYFALCQIHQTRWYRERQTRACRLRSTRYLAVG